MYCALKMGVAIPNANMLASPRAKEWEALGHLHNLASCELNSLRTCKQILMNEVWQVVILREQLQQALTQGNFGCAHTNLCLLIRANMHAVVGSAGLAPVVLELALRSEEHASVEEATCIRLARVLAVKLDQMRRFSV